MLGKLGQVLHNPTLKRYRFLISAFTSPRGSSEFTQTLSDLRARAIQEHLTAGLGFPEKQVLAYGFGARVNTDVIRVVNLGNVELSAPKPTVVAKPAAKVRLQAPKKPAVATLPRKRPPVVASVAQPDVTRPAVAKPRPAPSRKVVRVAPPVQKLRYPRAPAASGQVQTRPVGVFAPRQPVTRPGYFLWGGDGNNTGGGYGGGADAGGPSGGSSPGGPSGGSSPGGSSGGSSGGADPSGPSSGGWSQ
jgi:hypothetical protein